MNAIVVDVGNTSTCVALARSGRISRWQRVGSRDWSDRAFALAVQRAAAGVVLDGSVLSSVVPSRTGECRRVLLKVTGHRPLVVSHRLDLGVSIRYPRPATIGADRLANSAGAVARYGAPVIVADFGTALTFNVITPDGAYVGGVIAPGLPLMTDYLAERTALLPHITLGGRVDAVGRSTSGAMRIGARVGYRGMVREITRHLQAGPGLKRAALCATGGYAAWALRGSGLPFHIEADLTLFGLSCIFERHAGKGA